MRSDALLPAAAPSLKFLATLPPLEALDVAMLIILPVLLIFSGFFSGSETALFAMTETERMHLRKRGGMAGRAVEGLLHNPRMLLITVLLGNMVVNVAYFVISSVLIMRLTPETGVLGGAILAVITLLAIVLFGEVLPKMAANAHRERFASIIGPPVYGIHNLIVPLRIALDVAIVTPLSRLTAPSAGPPPQLDEGELEALLEISSTQGVIDVDEQRILREVVSMSRLRVRDVMTPRVRMAAVPINAGRAEVLEIVRESRHTKLPVYAGDMDNIVGILPVREFLLHPRAAQARVRSLMSTPVFVPQLATLDQVLQHFRKAHARSAIAVDEYGGTAGIVSVEDVVQRLVSESLEPAGPQRGDRNVAPVRQISRNEWHVDGDVSVHDWAEAFGQRLVSPRVATLGGLIIEHLGHAPAAGDVVRLGNVELEVLEVDRSRVVSAAARLKRDVHKESDDGP